MEKLLCLLVILIGLGVGNGQKTYNVVKYGAVGDGKTDDSKAFMAAWKETCGDSQTPTLKIPAGKTYLLQPVVFAGPCKSSNINFQINGNIVAPSTVSAWSSKSLNNWIMFQRVSHLTVVGSGKINGHGESWWGQTKKNSKRPTAIRFNDCNQLNVNGLHSINSPKNHVSISGCNDVFVSNIQLVAPKKSPNTDGIDISSSTNIRIVDAFVGTGDDCVAINGGCNGVNITRMNCAPGHGISIGSLGKHGSKETVENVFVQNCTFNGTQNGARIKTWKGGLGYAKNIRFQQIKLIDSQHPIIIDQSYCPHNKNCPPGESSVAIDNVKFIGFEGTSMDAQAITFNCSRTTSCKDIFLDRINIKPAKPGKKIISVSENAHGRCGGMVVPKVNLLA